MAHIVLLELEGTAEEMQRKLTDLPNQRLHETISSIESLTDVMPETSARKKSIEEELQALAAEIPLEERAKLPPDLTDNLDHYIYGLPKNSG